jgi:hypothetical protein
MLDDTIEQLRGTITCVRSAKDLKYTPAERHGFLMFAVMHACQAAIHGDSLPTLYGFAIHDYKHILIKAAEAVMNGKPIDEVMAGVQEIPLAAGIDWNYFSKGAADAS